MTGPRRGYEGTLSSVKVLDFEYPEWHKKANCRFLNNKNFFSGGIAKKRRVAIEVCAYCPVSFECLESAVRWCNNRGVWGGMLERERRQFAAKYAWDVDNNRARYEHSVHIRGLRKAHDKWLAQLEAEEEAAC